MQGSVGLTGLGCHVTVQLLGQWEETLAGAGAWGLRDWVYLHGVVTPGFVTKGGEEFRFVDCTSVVHRGLQGHPGLTWWDRAGWRGDSSLGCGQPVQGCSLGVNASIIPV